VDVPVEFGKLRHSVYRHQNKHWHSMAYLCSSLDVFVENSDTLYSGHAHVCSSVFMFCVYPLWKSFFHFLRFHSLRMLFNTNHSWSSELIGIRMSPLSIKHLFIFIVPSDFAHFLTSHTFRPQSPSTPALCTLDSLLAPLQGQQLHLRLQSLACVSTDNELLFIYIDNTESLQWSIAMKRILIWAHFLNPKHLPWRLHNFFHVSWRTSRFLDVRVS